MRNCVFLVEYNWNQETTTTNKYELTLNFMVENDRPQGVYICIVRENVGT